MHSAQLARFRHPQKNTTEARPDAQRNPDVTSDLCLSRHSPARPLQCGRHLLFQNDRHWNQQVNFQMSMAMQVALALVQAGLETNEGGAGFLQRTVAAAGVAEVQTLEGAEGCGLS
jgi:hypothetical protein